MAISSVLQTIRNAEIDARSLSEFVSKSPSFTVTRRLAPTIHTLDYYLLVLNNVKDKGDLADIVISDTLDKLEQLEPTVMQRVESAINNTAVEGGVLADTFVTVTASKPGSTPRNQRSKNADFVSIKDFGAIGDGVNDDTASFLAALDASESIYLPAGVYNIAATNHVLTQSRLNLFANNDATINILAGDSVGQLSVMTLNNQTEVSVSGVKVSRAGSSWRRLFSMLPESSVEVFKVERCEFTDYAMLCYFQGSYTIDPTVNYFGFQRVEIKDNTFRRSYTTPVNISDCPVASFLAEGNKFYDFERVGISVATENNGPYNLQVYFLNRELIVRGNTFINGDETFSRLEGYHCAVLLEGFKVIWENNYVEGLKSNYLNGVVYDAYLAGRIVVSKNNTVKDISALKATDSLRVFIKAKSRSEDALRCQKTITGNTYTISQEFIDKFAPEGNISHALFHLSDGIGGGGDVVVSDNVFHLNGFYRGYDGWYDNFTLKNNKIYANYFDDNSIRINLVSSIATENSSYIGSCVVEGNMWVFKNPSAVALSVFSQSALKAYKWVNFTFKSNHVEFIAGNKPPAVSALMDRYQAESTNITNNTFIGTSFDIFFRQCEAGELTLLNNVFQKSKIDYSELGEFRLFTNTSWGKNLHKNMDVDVDIVAKARTSTGLTLYFADSAEAMGIALNESVSASYSVSTMSYSTTTEVDFKYKMIYNESGLSLTFMEYIDEATSTEKTISLSSPPADTTISVASPTSKKRVGSVVVNAGKVSFVPTAHVSNQSKMYIRLESYGE